jgi:hypothetical protein
MAYTPKWASTSDPSPGQFLQKNRKKWSWGKGIVWNPRRQSLDIQKIADIEKGTPFPKLANSSTEIANASPCTIDSTTEYMSCTLPPAPNCVSIYLDSKTESEPFVASSVGGDKDRVFIGRLNLQRLGFFNQMSRFCGNLGTLYIVKHSPMDPPNSDNGDNASDDD